MTRVRAHTGAEADPCYRLSPLSVPQPLTVTVPKTDTRAPRPLLLLSVLILPPCPPSQPHPQSGEEPELPEMEIGTFEVNLALKGDFRSRVQWEQVKSALREEEEKWNKEGG